MSKSQELHMQEEGLHLPLPNQFPDLIKSNWNWGHKSLVSLSLLSSTSLWVLAQGYCLEKVYRVQENLGNSSSLFSFYSRLGLFYWTNSILLQKPETLAVPLSLLLHFFVLQIPGKFRSALGCFKTVEHRKCVAWSPLRSLHLIWPRAGPFQFHVPM